MVWADGWICKCMTRFHGAGCLYWPVDRSEDPRDYTAYSLSWGGLSLLAGGPEVG